MFTSPIFNNISNQRQEIASYNAALNNSKALESERDKLTQKYNSINPDNLVKLGKFLPDSVSNIRLILEIEQIAAPYGMTLKDVKYNTDSKADNKNNQTSPGVVQGGVVAEDKRDYGIFELEFTTTGTYDNFINFTKDLEKNLRIVDISTIEFTSDAGSLRGVSPKIGGVDSYDYKFKIKTYWLKN